MEYTLSKQIKEDKKISIAIMSSFAILTIQYFMLIFFDLIGTSTGEMVQLISKGIVGLFYLVALPIVLKRNWFKFIGIYFIAMFIFIFNYSVFNENWIYLKSVIFPLFFTGLPSLIYAYSISDLDVLMEIMKKVANIVFAVGTLIAIATFTGFKSVGAYSMSLSYYMLLPSIIYMNEFLNSMSVKKFITLTISLIVILALGSRGAIMCIGIFTILKLLPKLKTLTYKKIMLYLILFSIIILGIIFFKDIIEYIYNFLFRYGIKSRTLRLFMSDITYSSGRDSIYTDILQEIYNNPLLGFGLAGDRRLLTGRNAYVHNIIIEILGNFGIIIGMIVNVFLILLLGKSLLQKGKRNYTMIIIWISIGFVHLMISSSYLIDFKFWILLGLLFKNINYNNIKRKQGLN